MGLEGWKTFGSAIVGVSGGISSVWMAEETMRPLLWVSVDELFEETFLRNWELRGGEKTRRSGTHLEYIHPAVR